MVENYSELTIELTGAADIRVVKQKMLIWLKSFNIFCYLDNNHYQQAPNRYELLVGAGSRAILPQNELPELHAKKWWMGHVAYDYAQINYSAHQVIHASDPKYSFNALRFFQPAIVAYIPFGENYLKIESYWETAEEIWQQIWACNSEERHSDFSNTDSTDFWQKRLDKQTYIQHILQIQEKIKAGAFYEMNYCVESYRENITINPFAVYCRLNQTNPSPFSAFYRWKDNYLICASPERYLYKEELKLITQPIKGTSSRGANEAEDEQLIQSLLHNPKERAENVMIVDLSRNDLAKVSEVGSVSVEELFGVYSFPTVHQLISTVSSTVLPHNDFKEIIAACFPPGSMTGAPKLSVMQTIAALEKSRRELYAGSVGYINPQGDFDLNVVIRSIYYQEQSKYLSYQAGGAITIDSHPEKEWEELCLKGKAIESLF